MKTEDYKGLRHRLSHDVLRNEFLLRLGAPTAFFAQADPCAREQVLAECLAQISSDSRNLGIAIKTWCGDGKTHVGIADLVVDLHERAMSLKHVQPRETFPRCEDITAWLQAVGMWIARARSLADLPEDEQKALITNASQALRKLCDFVTALDVHSAGFWHIFRPVNS